MIDESAVKILSKIRADLGCEITRIESSKKDMNNRFECANNLFQPLDALRRFGAFSPQVDDLFSQNPEVASTISLSLTTKGKEDLLISLRLLHGKIKTVVDFYFADVKIERFLNRDDPNQLNIKLPDKMAFDTMADILRDLAFVFNICPPIREANDNNDVLITGVESGSIWLNLTLTAAAALSVIGGIMSLAFKFLYNVQFYKQQEQTIRAQELGNATAQAVQTLISAQANMLAKQYTDEKGLELDNEEVAKLTVTIERLGSLIERNVQVHPSIAAPKEVQEAFPTLEKYQEVLQLLGGGKPLELKEKNEE